MAYDFAEHMKDLHQVLQESTEWFMRVTRLLHYPSTSVQTIADVYPGTFDMWAEKVRSAQILEPETLAWLVRMNEDMRKQADRLVLEAKTYKRRPDFSDYDRLALYFEEFINRIRRLEKDYYMEESGLDVLTGFRKADVMFADLAEEMERVARQGKPFALAVIRIDGFHEHEKHLSPEAVERMIADAALLVKKSIRSFDDAYRVSDAVFVLALKQTTIEGGVKALNRLKVDVTDFAGVYEGRNGKVSLTLSSNVMEPVPADDLREIVKELQDDLERWSGRTELLLQYSEKSPLMRFVSEKSTVS